MKAIAGSFMYYVPKGSGVDHMHESQSATVGAFLDFLPLLGVGETDVSSTVQALIRSDQALDRARELLSEEQALRAYGVDFIAFGSLARREMTPSSDLDYLLIGKNREWLAGEFEEYSAARDSAVKRLREGMMKGVTLANPGTSGLFGATIDPDELTENIGLQPDTNNTLTRRLLFLEESVSLLDEKAHRELLQKILQKYLASQKPGSQIVPRVLLNDIVRYWRTVAVDYHAKSSPEEPYSLRYLKLLIPRKLCYLSSLAPLCLLNLRSEKADTLEFLRNAFEQPAPIRLVRLLTAISDGNYYEDAEQMRNSAKEILKIQNNFISKAGDASWRVRVAEECKDADPRNSRHFGRMRENGRQLHGLIGDIFFCEALTPFTKEYMLS